jgi:ADP-heptose:LPS heptosyltransferase
MRIIFITATRIGDAVLSTGLLAWLVARHPEARFTIAAGPVAAPLFEAVPRLERLIVVEKRAADLHWPALWAKVVPFRWDIVVDLRGSALAFLVRAGARHVAGPADRTAHKVEQLGRLLGLDPPPSPKLWTTPAHERAAAALVPEGTDFLAVGPAANWRGKEWPAERFAELARRLTARDGLLPGAPVAVLAAAHERTQAAPLLASVPGAIDLVGRTDLLTAAALLRRAGLFVGNDTGLMHLAAAAGAPTLGLFGPSPAWEYAPWGPHTAVAQTERGYRALVGAPGFDPRTAESLMDSLSVEAVEEAARALWRRRSAA